MLTAACDALRTLAGALLLAQGQSPTKPSSTAAATADYQPYVFWAYASACLLILLFTLASAVQASRLARKIDYLEGRFRETHPEG
jgi:hypothetical protein